MSLSFCVLASGSAGNCTLVALNGAAAREPRYFLIDAGLSPRRTARLLADLGLGLERVRDVLLTHLDGDHFRRGWIKAAQRFGLHLHLHEDHIPAVAALGLPCSVFDAFGDQIVLDAAGARTSIQTMKFPHDELGTVGFVIEHEGQRLGYATDLGHAPPQFYERFVNLDALAIESNYDPPMQLSSRRPLFLKRRIMGGAGHLSNEQSLEAVLRVAGRSPLHRVALLHLSQECNHPRKIGALYAQRAPHLRERLTITRQDRPTKMIRVTGGVQRQLALFAT